MCDADPKCNAFTLDPHGKPPRNLDPTSALACQIYRRCCLSFLTRLRSALAAAAEAVCNLLTGKYLRVAANWGGTCVGKTFCWTYASYKALHPGSSTFGSKGDLPPPPPKPAPGASCVMQQDFFGTVSRASRAASNPQPAAHQRICLLLWDVLRARTPVLLCVPLLT